MFDNDDIAMQGFRKIEEAAEPWAQPKKKVVKTIKEAVEEKAAELAEDVEEAVTAKAEAVAEAVEEVNEADAIEKAENSSSSNAEEEYCFDDCNAPEEEKAEDDKFEEEYKYDDYMDPDWEYAYDDAEDPVPESAMPTGEDMPQGENAERDALVEGLCRWGAARAGAVVVIPGWGAVGLIANEVYMIMRIARAYGVQLSTGAAAAALSSLGATFIGQTISTLVPFPPLQMPIAISVTYGVGKAVAAWMEAGMPGSLAEFKDVFDKARNHAANNVSEYKNLDCKDIPLGDETKKAPLSERAFDAFGSGFDWTGEKLTDMFGYLGNAVGEKFEELKQEHEAKVEAEKDLPEEEKGFYANARDNFDKNVEELQAGLKNAVEQAGKELKEAFEDSALGKLFADKEDEAQAKATQEEAEVAEEAVQEEEIAQAEPAEEAVQEEEIAQAEPAEEAVQEEEIAQAEPAEETAKEEEKAQAEPAEEAPKTEEIKG